MDIGLVNLLYRESTDISSKLFYFILAKYIGRYSVTTLQIPILSRGISSQNVTCVTPLISVDSLYRRFTRPMSKDASQLELRGGCKADVHFSEVPSK
jgi:hypothetical protein